MFPRAGAAKHERHDGSVLQPGFCLASSRRPSTATNGRGQAVSSLRGACDLASPASGAVMMRATRPVRGRFSDRLIVRRSIRTRIGTGFDGRRRPGETVIRPARWRCCGRPSRRCLDAVAGHAPGELRDIAHAMARPLWVHLDVRYLLGLSAKTEGVALGIFEHHPLDVVGLPPSGLVRRATVGERCAHRGQSAYFSGDIASGEVEVQARLTRCGSATRKNNRSGAPGSPRSRTSSGRSSMTA
jgi:hypothetical protein